MELSNNVVKLDLQDDETDTVTIKEMERQKEEQTVMKTKKYLKFYEAGVILCTICYFSACPIMCNIESVCSSSKENGGDGMCQWWFYVYACFWIFGLVLCFALVMYKNTNWKSLRLITRMPSFWAVVLWICIILYTDISTPYFSLSPANGLIYFFGQLFMLLLDAVKYKHRNFVICTALVAVAFNMYLIYTYIVTNKEDGVSFGYIFGAPLEKRPIKRSLFISVMVLLASSIKRVITDKEQKYLIFFASPAYRITSDDMKRFQEDANHLNASNRHSLVSVMERHDTGENTATTQHRFLSFGIVICVLLYVPLSLTIEYLNPANTVGLTITTICCVLQMVCLVMLLIVLLRQNMSNTLLKRNFKEPKVIIVSAYCIFFVVLALFNNENNESYFAGLINALAYMSIVISTICLDACTLQIRQLKLLVTISLFLLNTFFVFERVFGEVEKNIVFAKYLSVTLMTRSLKRSAYFNINALILDGLWCLLFDKKDEKMMFVKNSVLAEI